MSHGEVKPWLYLRWGRQNGRAKKVAMLEYYRERCELEGQWFLARYFTNLALAVKERRV